MRTLLRRLAVLCFAVLAASSAREHRVPAASAQRAKPPSWQVIGDDFESGSLDRWRLVSPDDLRLTAGAGLRGSTALSISLGASERYLVQSGVAQAVEGYLSFWFHPGDAQLPEPEPNPWPPGTALCVARLRSSAGDWWPPMISFHVRQLPDGEYVGFLGWPQAAGYTYDDATHPFPLAKTWQKITLGYRIDEWVALWLGDTLVRYETKDVVHEDPYADVVEVGKVNRNTQTTPSGTILLDDVAFEVPRVDELWVSQATGTDDADGRSPATAFATIQKAAALAGPGTVVHVMPGVYREAVRPALSGSRGEPVRFVAEAGPGTAIVRGSESSASLRWRRVRPGEFPGSRASASALWVTDLSTWQLRAPPRFITQMGRDGSVTARLALAREPDWRVATEWKHHEYWWAATGGSASARCDPAVSGQSDCDQPWRSMTELTDDADDAEPAGIEPGNLTTLGDLLGATIVVVDTRQGHYTYRRKIVAHDVATGRITVDRICEHDTGTGIPGLGWGSKYYLENHPALLDSPGEWWYDPATGHLYLWPPETIDPAQLGLEISRREHGFNLKNRSYVTLYGLTIELYNGAAVHESNWSGERSYGNTVRNATLRHANWGVFLEQSIQAEQSPANITDGFSLENSEVGPMDTMAIRLTDWWENNAAAGSFRRSGVVNTVIRGNEMHHLGFRSDYDSGVGMVFQFANRLRFEENHVHHVAHNGVMVAGSVVQSDRTYGFAPDEIKTGTILFRGNLFERACQAAADCGGLKIWGKAPDKHVFRDLLVTDNVFRDSFGWTWIAEKRGRWSGGAQSAIRGLGGFGLYVDHASGVHAYRNVSYNNAFTGYMVYGMWRDGLLVYYNNVAANSLYGISLSGGQYDSHGSVDTQVVNNILVNNEAYGLLATYAEGRTANTVIDHNLYSSNGWRSYDQGGIWRVGDILVRQTRADGSSTYEPYAALAEAQAATPWEAHGMSGDPAFWRYDRADHDLLDGSWPDFHLTAASNAAIDRGAAALPDSLTALLTQFGVGDWHWGPAYDIGRYEAGFALHAEPAEQTIRPGGTAAYRLRLEPPDLPHTVTLSVALPSPHLAAELSSTVASPSAAVTLTLSHDRTAGAGLRYEVPITATGGGFLRTSVVRLAVEGARLFLPLGSRLTAP